MSFFLHHFFSLSYFPSCGWFVDTASLTLTLVSLLFHLVGLFVELQESSASNTVVFMQQMIPHHENAMNMARILLKNPGNEDLNEEVSLSPGS